MLPDEQLISLTIMKLIVGFFAGNNSEEDNERLDEWICEDEVNMKIFGDCVEATIRK